jgi:hypothetical protein
LENHGSIIDRCKTPSSPKYPDQMWPNQLHILCVLKALALGLKEPGMNLATPLPPESILTREATFITT